jgi:hypothetical protein
MKDFFNKAKSAAGDIVNSTATKLGEVAKEHRPEPGDMKRAADFLVDAAGKTATEISKLGKDALKTELAKDAAAGAAIGAVVAIPVPLIGPIAGAVVGAGLGVYKNLRQTDTAPAAPATESPQAQLTSRVVEVEAKVVPNDDGFQKLERLHDLKVKGILTEEEFAAEKKKVLDR